MVTVIMPAYNEKYNIGNVLARIPRRYHVIVIDDGSKDRTADVVKAFGYEVIRTRHNGKAHACMTGIRNSKSELNVFIDSDGQLYPEDIPRVVKALRNHDLVLGQRNMKDIPWQRRFSNHFSARVVHFLVGKEFKDVLCGLRGIRKSKMRNMRIREKGYEFEIDTIIEAVRNNLKIGTVPVRVSYTKGSRMPRRKSITLFARMILKCLRKIVSQHP